MAILLALIFGAAGAVLGYFAGLYIGPALWPESNQSGLLGPLFLAPLGLVLGALAGVLAAGRGGPARR